MTIDTFAITTPAGWSELLVGRWFIAADTQYLYADMLAMTPQKRTALGIKRVEKMPMPDGKVPVGEGRIEDRDGKPVKVWDLEDAPTVVILPEMVDAERDQHIDAGFSFAGKRYQSRPKDRENILGAASLAHMALTLQAKQPGDLRWHGGDSDFVWIAEDNSLVPMDAIAVIGFGNAAAMHKSDHTFAARLIKNMDPIPVDYAEDGNWPPQEAAL